MISEPSERSFQDMNPVHLVGSGVFYAKASDTQAGQPYPMIGTGILNIHASKTIYSKKIKLIGNGRGINTYNSIICDVTGYWINFLNDLKLKNVICYNVHVNRLLEFKTCGTEACMSKSCVNWFIPITSGANGYDEEFGRSIALTENNRLFVGSPNGLDRPNKFYLYGALTEYNAKTGMFVKYYKPFVTDSSQFKYMTMYSANKLIARNDVIINKASSAYTTSYSNRYNEKIPLSTKIYGFSEVDKKTVYFGNLPSKDIVINDYNYVYSGFDLFVSGSKYIELYAITNNGYNYSTYNVIALNTSKFNGSLQEIIKIRKYTSYYYLYYYNFGEHISINKKYFIVSAPYARPSGVSFNNRGVIHIYNNNITTDTFNPQPIATIYIKNIIENNASHAYNYIRDIKFSEEKDNVFYISFEKRDYSESTEKYYSDIYRIEFAEGTNQIKKRDLITYPISSRWKYYDLKPSDRIRLRENLIIISSPRENYIDIYYSDPNRYGEHFKLLTTLRQEELDEELIYDFGADFDIKKNTLVISAPNRCTYYEDNGNSGSYSENETDIDYEEEDYINIEDKGPYQYTYGSSNGSYSYDSSSGSYSYSSGSGSGSYSSGSGSGSSGSGSYLPECSNPKVYIIDLECLFENRGIEILPGMLV